MDTELRELLIKYLSMGSADGKPERRELRKQLAEMVGMQTTNGVEISKK